MLSPSTELKNDRPVVLYKGTFKPSATVGEAVFMITGMTIGAGVLGLPYAVARVGLIAGLAMILALGVIMLCLNLMIGEVAVRTSEPLQLPGLAGKYLGAWAKDLLTLIILFISFGALLAYLVGEGAALSALFGGSSLAWGIIFWSLSSFFLWGGLQRIKILEKFFGAIVIAIITGIALFLFRQGIRPSAAILNFNADWLFFSFGIILFAFHSTSAVAEAHALLPGSERHFKRALIIGSAIPIALYLLFAAAVVIATPGATTEIATVGLGNSYGRAMIIFANIFAIFAMSTGFMGLGNAVKETLVWDNHFPKTFAKFLVSIIPLGLFLLGIRSFIKIIEVTGGLFISLEALVMILVYWRAKTSGDLSPRFFNGKTWVVAVPIFLLFVAIAVLSSYNLIFN